MTQEKLNEHQSVVYPAGVCAWHANENPASGKMQEKVGMKREGILRQGCKCNNGIYDKVVYAILAEDYFSQA